MESSNILLIVLDAVRPDHCSCYGYERKTTPNIDKIAIEGIRYTNAFSNSNWTAEAHGALFTGQLPSISGVYGKNLRLPNSTPTLPELLSDAGYETFGVSAGAHIRADRGYDRGFSNFYSSSDTALTTGIGDNLRAKIEHKMIEKTRGGDLRTHFKARGLTQHFRKSQKPFFGFVNFKTAHGPYKNAPEPYKSYYTDDSIRPANPILDRVYREFLDKEPDQIDGIDYERLCRLASDFPVITGEFEPTHEEWDIIKDWYDGSIRYMDAKIGMILQSLKKEDELDNTWIIITSDHGELFGEHGLQSHVFSLYEELLRIPLIIHPPNNTNKKVSGMCSWIDLYPTICEIVGIDYPDRRHAKSLLPIGSDPGHHHLYAEVGRKDNPKIKENHPDFETIRENGPLQSIRDESWKLIRYPSNDVDLFNRVEDPVEQNECSNENPEVVERLLKKMNSELEHMDSFSYHQADEILSPEVENQLEFLGYR